MTFPQLHCPGSLARLRNIVKINKIFLGTDGAASSQVGQILPFYVEGSIPYSAPVSDLRESFYCERVTSDCYCLYTVDVAEWA